MFNDDPEKVAFGIRHYFDIDPGKAFEYFVAFYERGYVQSLPIITKMFNLGQADFSKMLFNAVFEMKPADAALVLIQLDPNASNVIAQDLSPAELERLELEVDNL